MDSVAKHYKITNASFNTISHFGHIMIPAEHRNYKPSFELVEAKVSKTARTIRHSGVIGRIFLAEALLLSLINFHSFAWAQVKVKDLEKNQNTIDKIWKCKIPDHSK